MKKSISVNKKSRGRPKKVGGVYPVTAVRLAPALGAAVDKWAAAQEGSPKRSEAIRRLVEIGLATKGRVSPNQRSGSQADRAKELASNTIEKMADPTAAPKERAARHRRLTKGPSEFQEDRVDQRKTKGK